MLAGLWGSGNGTNTFGENVGTIGNDYKCAIINARIYDVIASTDRT